jgi:N-acetylmuramoyl-L-alanine amidase
MDFSRSGLKLRSGAGTFKKIFREDAMVRAVKSLAVLALWMIGCMWPGGVGAENRVLTIRHWVAPDHTRVVIDCSDDAVYTVEKEERKIAINLEDTSLPLHIPGESALNKPGLERMTLLPRGTTGVRVELVLPAQAQTTVFKLKPFEDKPYRVVIDIVRPEITKKESEAREQVKITRKDRIVVIDPGHGGEAVGAVGKAGTMEKDVVLSISRKLRDLLNARPGYRAFLTRDGDYYVPFSKRLQIAREYGADLFVSVHADAARNRAAMGSSVYCLSTGGAVSAAAKILARSENLADIVGGVSNGEGKDASDPIILNMFQTHAINQSKTFGDTLLKNISGVGRLKFTTVQEAPFYVLKLPEIPSVLIETAYISNPTEEKLLRTDRFQSRMAEGIVRSVVKFLPPLPAVPVFVAGGKGGGTKPSVKMPAADAQSRTAEKTPPEAVREPQETAGGQTLDAVLAGMASGASAPDAKARTAEASAPVAAGESREAAKAKTPEPVSADTAAAERQPEATVRPPAEAVKQPREAGKAKKAEPASTGAPAREIKTAQKTPGAVGGQKAERVDPAASRPEGKNSGKAKAEKAPSGPEKTFPYRVRYGESLDRIARRYGTTVGALVTLNQLKPNAPLYVGRLLKIPGEPPSATVKGEGVKNGKAAARKPQPVAKPERPSYRVKKGDTLETIARKHGTTVDVLAELNGLKPAARLFVDRKLLLPGGASL